MADSVQTMVNNAKCLCGVSKEELLRMIAVNINIGCGGVGSCSSLSGDAPPTGSVTPQFIGQLYIRNPGPSQTYYYSTGLTNADWTLIDTTQAISWSTGFPTTFDGTMRMSDSTVTEIDIPFLTSVGGFNLSNNASATTITMPNLATCSASLSFNSCSALTAINLPLLTAVQTGLLGLGDFDMTSCSALTSLNVPLLATVDGALTFNGCPSLPSASFPSLTGASSLNASANASMASLTAAVLASVGSAFDVQASGLTALNLPSLSTIGDKFDCNSCASLASLSMASLASISTDFLAQSCASLASVTLTSLASVGGIFNISGDTSLTTLSLPALTTIGGNVSSLANTALVSVAVPVWVPTDGTTIDFSNNALDVTSVDLILHRCVLAGLTTATIDLSGGTSATPSGAGLADKATLIGNGCTVATN